MKQLLNIAIVLLLVGGVFGCKKDNDSDPISNPQGFWKGLYGSGTNPQTLDYAFLFRNNGTVRVYSQSSDTSIASKAEGVFTVNGKTVTTYYTYFSGSITGTYSTSATANSADNMMTGTYGSGTATNGGGTFTVSRQ